MKSSPRVLIVLGSTSDKEIIEPAISTLKSFQVPFEVRISSAHRTPKRTVELAQQAESKGFKVIIAAAGWSAGLPGTLAAESILPVIGVPVPSSVLLGMDAMLSMVQMPPGVPVATVAVGKGGAKNAALLAIQILANEFEELKEPLKKYKRDMAQSVIEAAEEYEFSWME
ncbi:MAG: 5-(carboxyamino)imidazole ribonucleotide mutase [bacterium]